MAYIRSSKGTPEQFLNAVKNRIAELEGSDIDIESAEDIDVEDDIESGCHGKKSVESASDVSDEFYDPNTGLKYWYFTRHGVMPGSVPKGLDILDVVDRPEGSYFLTDRVINTKALNWYDIKERAPEGVEACDNISGVIEEEIEASEYLSADSPVDDAFDVNEVLEFLDNKGYDTSKKSVQNYADAVAEYMDTCRFAYENQDLDEPYTLDDWYSDTRMNYPEELEELLHADDEIESACNSCNIMAGDELSVEDQEKVYEIADRYTTSDPASGDWDTETQHEQQAIADELKVSLDEAKEIMKLYLGFTDDMFKVEAASEDFKVDSEKMTYDYVEAADEIDEEGSKESIDDYDKAYLDKVQARLDDWVEDLKWDKDEGRGNSPVASISFETDDNNLYATVTLSADDSNEDVSIHSYTVPYDDLSFDYDEIDNDVDYIVEAISKDVDAKTIESSTAIQADFSDYDFEENFNSRWKELASKQIYDSDGFLTEYTLYEYQGHPRDIDFEPYICMYGDKDLYAPDPSYADWSGDNSKEAWEWFDNYSTEDFDDYDDDDYDDEEDIY